MGLCHLDHAVILKLLWLGIVNKLPNLKVSSSVVKKVYLTWLLVFLGELAPPYKVLDVDVYFSRGLVFGLLDVRQVFIPGLPVTGALFKAIGKGLKHSIWIIFVPFHLVLQGCPLLWSLLATVEENMGHLGLIGSASNNEVLLQPLPVEGPCSLLVLCILIHPGDHVWWYVYRHRDCHLEVCLDPYSDNISLWEGVVAPQVNFSLWEDVAVMKWQSFPRTD